MSGGLGDREHGGGHSAEAGAGAGGVIKASLGVWKSLVRVAAPSVRGVVPTASVGSAEGTVHADGVDTRGDESCSEDDRNSFGRDSNFFRRKELNPTVVDLPRPLGHQRLSTQLPRYYPQPIPGLVPRLPPTLDIL